MGSLRGGTAQGIGNDESFASSVKKRGLVQCCGGGSDPEGPGRQGFVFYFVPPRNRPRIERVRSRQDPTDLRSEHKFLRHREGKRELAGRRPEPSVRPASQGVLDKHLVLQRVRGRHHVGYGSGSTGRTGARLHQIEKFPRGCQRSVHPEGPVVETNDDAPQGRLQRPQLQILLQGEDVRSQRPHDRFAGRLSVERSEQGRELLAVDPFAAVGVRCGGAGGGGAAGAAGHGQRGALEHVPSGPLAVFGAAASIS